MSIIMAKVSIFGVLSNVQILLRTFLRGKAAGQDAFGNRYYRGKPRSGTTIERRWVIYKGAPEASTIPPEWHGWLHYQTNVVPSAESAHRQVWQKPHLPNQTGTDGAYLPPGHTLKGGKRDHATGDYVAWQPPQ